MAQMNQRVMRPMETAPTDGTVVQIFKEDGSAHYAGYYDCSWLRASGDDVADCWRDPLDLENDIELDEAAGWLPLDVK